MFNEMTLTFMEHLILIKSAIKKKDSNKKEMRLNALSLLCSSAKRNDWKLALLFCLFFFVFISNTERKKEREIFHFFLEKNIYEIFWLMHIERERERANQMMESKLNN